LVTIDVQLVCDPLKQGLRLSLVARINENVDALVSPFSRYDLDPVEQVIALGGTTLLGLARSRIS
jgi:hypothetical protein